MDDKILILGSNGLLGDTASQYFTKKKLNIFAHSRDLNNKYKADLRDKNQVASLLGDINPDVIFNFVALTNVDACENPNDAYHNNVQTLENIVHEIKVKNLNSYLIHISTDHVYDKKGYNIEEDIKLTNYYAFSKYTAEKVAESVESCILRTNFFGLGGDGRESFTDWILKTLLSGDEINAFSDVYFNPLSMTTLISKLDEIKNLQLTGVFNLGSKNGMSKSDFIFLFAEEMRLPTKKIKKISVDNANFIKTYRPKEMRMDVSKVEKLLMEKLPSLRDEIKLVAEEYNNEI